MSEKRRIDIFGGVISIEEAKRRREAERRANGSIQEAMLGSDEEDTLEPEEFEPEEVDD